MAAAVFAAIFRTRFVPLLVVVGMTMLAGGAVVLTGVANGPQARVPVGAGLVGLGVGACVSPALFLSGWSLASAQIQRVFALIGLLRGVAAFMIAPILLHLAQTVSKQPAAGIQASMWICFGIAAGGGLLAVTVFALGRARLQAPDLETYLEGEEPAIDSPPLGAALRGRAALAGR